MWQVLNRKPGLGLRTGRESDVFGMFPARHTFSGTSVFSVKYAAKRTDTLGINDVDGDGMGEGRRSHDVGEVDPGAVFVSLSLYRLL